MSLNYGDLMVINAVNASLHKNKDVIDKLEDEKIFNLTENNDNSCGDLGVDNKYNYYRFSYDKNWEKL